MFMVHRKSGIKSFDGLKNITIAMTAGSPFGSQPNAFLIYDIKDWRPLARIEGGDDYLFTRDMGLLQIQPTRINSLDPMSLRTRSN